MAITQTQTLQKHRFQRDWFAFDFTAQLAEDETLSAPSVSVRLLSGGSYHDRSAQFVEGGTVLVMDNQVRVLLKIAAPDEQVPGQYDTFARATTNTGRALTLHGLLEVIGPPINLAESAA